jgi:4-amino-4-deoxy-L-arabinose transferase-like glycosyltransferase
MSDSIASSIPRSFPACLPWLWSRVLFPGETNEATAWRWPALLLLLLLPGLLLYPCLSFYLFEPDEGRYAEIPREMSLRGSWIVPYLQGEPYLDKPPLLYWLVMLSYSLFGVHDWAARLVPAFAVHATVLITYLVGRRGFGERVAFRGALALALTPGLLGVGRLLTMDGLLTLWVTVGLLAVFEATRMSALRRGWLLLAAAACGLGLLTKGPIALVLVLPPLWLHRRLTGTGASLRRRDQLAFLGIALLLSLPWYVGLCMSNPEFSRHFLWEHNVLRFLQPFDHLEPVWYYLPILALGLFPATVLVLPLARYLGTGQARTAATRSPALGFALLAGFWCVLFFSLSGSKLPTYILPALPLLALALGHFLVHSDWHRAKSVYAVAGAGLLMQFAGHFVLVPWYAEYRSPLGQWAAIAQYCGDRQTPVVCYPRMCHSVAFYLGREEVTWFRSKEIEKLREALRDNPKTVLLLSHRHSLAALNLVLPPEFEIKPAAHFGLPPVAGVPPGWGRSLAKTMGETALGLADLAVVEPRRMDGEEESDPRNHAKGHENK